MPGASYLLAWPLLGAVVGIAAWIRAEAEDAPVNPGLAAVLGAAAIPAAILLAPTTRMLFIGLTSSAAHVIVILPALGFALLSLQLDALRLGQRRPLPLLALAAGILVLGAGSISAGFNARHPRPNSLCYLLDADTDTSSWVTADHQLDEWTSQVFSGAATEPAEGRFRFQTAAPKLALPAPELEVIGDRSSDGARTLQMRISSPRRAPILRLRIETGGGAIRSLNLPGGSGDGRPLVIGQEHVRLRCVAPPADGIELGLELEGAGPVSIELEDRSFGLPALDPPLPPRPPTTICKPYGYSDLTRVRRTIEVPAL
jgi:hypothetical protein